MARQRIVHPERVITVPTIQDTNGLARRATTATRQFRLTINCENDAFEGCCGGDCGLDSAAQEIARILRDVAHRLEEGEDFSMYQTLFDVNGNDCGRAALKELGRF